MNNDQRTTPSPEQWIDHDGSACPVPGEAVVEVKFRDGRADKAPAKFWRWEHFHNIGDIIAYRLAPTAAPGTPETDALLATIPVGTIAALWHFDKAVALCADLESRLRQSEARERVLRDVLSGCSTALNRALTAHDPEEDWEDICRTIQTACESINQALAQTSPQTKTS